MSNPEKSFLPAAGSDWLLPFYDFFTKILGVEAAHRHLIEQADIQGAVARDGTGDVQSIVAVRRRTPDATAEFHVQRTGTEVDVTSDGEQARRVVTARTNRAVVGQRAGTEIQRTRALDDASICGRDTVRIDRSVGPNIDGP